MGLTGDINFFVLRNSMAFSSSFPASPLDQAPVINLASI